ncbi:hypothetical protein AAFF_G00236980 [Aldrovandia affinis]|uniref:Uncharacterized protein n=1 Tax=Aldrovandia affinis TaxID=143900 RepID=A0AAD7RF50_9TELE|nr:hypothetical protein AAFF_G00236980 [Aldrovandia affinis]
MLLVLMASTGDARTGQNVCLGWSQNRATGSRKQLLESNVSVTHWGILGQEARFGGRDGNIRQSGDEGLYGEERPFFEAEHEYSNRTLKVEGYGRFYELQRGE